MADPTGTANRSGQPLGPRLRLTEPTPEACDHLAEMFLGEPLTPKLAPTPTLEVEVPRSNAQNPAHVPVRRVEAVVLGHLPVLPSAWLSVYAEHQAKALGRPVAIAQLRPGATTIEASTPSRGEPSPSLRQATERAGDSNWLVRLPELAEPTLASLRGLTHVTILTSDDEAAIVSTYRAIKAISTQLAESRARPKPRLAVGVLARPGASGRTNAQAGAGRIRTTAKAFLGDEPEIIVFQGRIEPRRLTTLFSGGGVEAQTLLDRVASTPMPARPSAPARSSAVALDAIADSIRGELVARPVRDDAAAPLASDTAPDTAPVAASAWAPQLDGLHALGVTCPYAKDVELAIDPVGRLHLLAEAMDEHARPRPPGDATAKLLNAAAWAHDHRALLALKDARLAEWLEDPTSPSLHVVVADAKEARPLLDTSLTVHLAVRTRAAAAGCPARDGLMLVDLNDPE